MKILLKLGDAVLPLECLEDLQVRHVNDQDSEIGLTFCLGKKLPRDEAETFAREVLEMSAKARSV